MFKNRYFLLAAAVLLAVFAGWMALHYIRERPQRADVEKWRSLSEKTTTWLKERNFAEIKKTENAVLTSVASRPAAVFFARFAINCAKSRRMGMYGDPYVFLLKAEEVLGNDVNDPNLPTVLYDLANEQFLINSYHRAFRLLELIPEDRRSSEAKALHTQLTTLFTIFRTTTAELDKTIAATSGDQAISRQLRDLLGILPQNFAYSEQSLVSDHAGSHEENITDENQHLALTLPPIGISTFTPFEQLPPLPQAINSVEYEEDPLEETDVDEEQNYYDSSLENVALSASERRRAYQLLSTVRNTGFLDKSSTDFKAVTRSILSRSSSEQLTLNDLEQGSPIGSALALVFSDSLIYLLIGNSLDSLRVLSWQPDREAFQIVDVTGDGVPELITRYTAGSGRFLDITIVDPLTRRAVFDEGDLARGEVRMIDIDNDAALELLVIEKVELQRVDCTQCPARYLLTVHDYDTRHRKYRPTGRKLSYGELNSLATNCWGLSNLVLETGDRLQGVNARIRQALQTLQQQETRNWSNDLLLELQQLFGALDSAEDSTTALSHDKLDLQTALVQTLNRPDLPSPWLELRRQGQLWRVYTLIQMREPERVFELTSEPWLLQGTPPTPLFRAELFNVNGVSHQMLGRMSQAYDSFSNAMKELQELPLETAHQLEGNLSFYFTTLGDMPTSYMYAQRALDNAIVADYAEATAQDTSDETTDVANEGNGKEKIEKDESVIEISQSQAMDMMQLAQISWRTGQEKQALDWMGRALRFGRRDGNSAITTGVFRIAADIALSNNWPDLALQFLDEAMLGTNELTWKTEGGAVFLLYAKALSAKHDQRQAIELLKVSAKFSKDVDPTVHCRALYSISRIMRDLNDSAEALKYARLAFEGLTSARRSVGVEEQKFSFLSDKKTIASWLLHLLIETNQDSMQLLHAIESWKMRTFLDLHDEKMAGLAAPLTETELSSRLSAILNDDDLLLDYVELDSSAIVLAVTKHQGIQVHTIKASPTDTAALRTKVLRGFDIRERSSLAAIRSGNVDSELDDSLRKLYSEILGPIQIPNNIKRLIIAPDEFLFGVPWPALKPSDTAYLTDRYEIVLIPSAVVAIAVNNSRPEPARYQRSLIACALGGVESSEMEDRVNESQPKVDYPPLARLSGGWNECQKVATALKDTEVELLADAETLKQYGRFSESRVAAPERFLAKAPGARIIHLVGHGIYDLKQPMQSKLFLDNGASGRIVRAADLSSINLTGVELVTLAACESGQYEAKVGAEPIGFLRALLGAGASTVLLANWEVDDNTTADLLSDFYSRLRYVRKSTALRQAQQVIKQRYKHPYFWAAHSMYGSWS